MAETLTRSGPAKAAPAAAPAPAAARPAAPAAKAPPHPQRVYRSAPTAQPAPDAPKASVHDRLKAILSAPADPPPTAGLEEGDAAGASGGIAPSLGEVSQEQSEAPSQEEAEVVPAQADQPDDGDGKSGDAQSEDWQPSSLDELAEALAWDSDKLFGLNAKVKIDGKEGTATLRDLVKSYQLDGHINQKLASVDTDRKALLAEREHFNSERADKLLKLDAGIKTLERSLLGEFQSIDWQRLAASDPASYNAQLVAFQQRKAALNDVAAQIGQEQQQYQQQISEAQQKWLDDQRKLLQSKVPEWADEGRRTKDRAEIATYLNSVGITNDEFEALGDHRWALVIRDAYDMAKLRKGKPAVLNKVKAAPKLLKPGSQQSKDVVSTLASNRERDTLRQSGKVRDAKPVFKRLLFGAAS